MTIVKPGNLLSATTLCAMLTFVLLTGCGKKDNDNTPAAAGIDMATGTFKGTLTVHPVSGTSEKYFDAIMNVSKTGDNKLTVSPKSGAPYSIATPKTFIVETQSTMGQGVVATAGSTEGSFVYKKDIKSLQAASQQQSASEVTFFFEGTKQ